MVEILSPDDAAAQKLPFYTAHQVDDLVIIDPRGACSGSRSRTAQAVTHSTLIDLNAEELTGRLNWLAEEI